MKKLTSLVLAIVFTLTMALAAINTANSPVNTGSQRSLALTSGTAFPECGHGVKGGCSACMLGGNKFNQATYAYTGKNVNPQLGTPLSVPNIDSKAYNHCFSAYKH